MRTILIQFMAFALIFMFAAYTVDANAQEREEDRRFSMSISGGVSFASASAGGRIDGGFDIESKTNLTFGLGIQYTITPYWSIEGKGYYHKFENANDNDPNYESNVVSITVRNIIHLNQLLGINEIWSTVTPYALAGSGIAFRDSDVVGNSPSASLAFGLGTGIRLTNAVNFYLQYEYHATGDIDGASFRSNSDHYGLIVGGLRIHFGSENARPHSERPAAFRISETEYNALMALGSRVDNLERSVSSQGNQINTLDGRVDALDSRVDGHEGRISDLERQYADLHAKVRDLEEEMAKQPERDEIGLTQDLADGFYVQVYAAHTMADAQRVARNLSGMVDSPVLITKRHNVYEVRTGVYQRFPSAANTLRAVTGTYSDAFVVQFPRPAHLSEDYRDIRRVD